MLKSLLFEEASISNSRQLLYVLGKVAGLKNKMDKLGSASTTHSGHFGHKLGTGVGECSSLVLPFQTKNHLTDVNNVGYETSVVVDLSSGSYLLKML